MQVASVELSQISLQVVWEAERAEHLVVFVVASLIIIMHKVAWVEAYNP